MIDFNTVSYTHLDVYKRQVIRSVIFRPAGQQLLLFISRIPVAETGAHGKCAGAHNVLRAPGLVVAYKFDKLFRRGSFRVIAVVEQDVYKRQA